MRSSPQAPAPEDVSQQQQQQHTHTQLSARLLCANLRLHRACHLSTITMRHSQLCRTYWNDKATVGATKNNGIPFAIGMLVLSPSTPRRPPTSSTHVLICAAGLRLLYCFKSTTDVCRRAAGALVVCYTGACDAESNVVVYVTVHSNAR